MTPWTLGCWFGTCNGIIAALVVIGIEGDGWRWPAIVVFAALSLGILTWHAIRHCGKDDPGWRDPRRW